MDEPSVAETIRAIRDYLRQNPNAQDTQDGILHWWLTELPTKPREVIVKKALEYLVREGLLSEHRGKDAQVSYRMKNPVH